MCQGIFIKAYAYLHYFMRVCILSLMKEVLVMEQTIGRTIGAQVRAWRAARGLTQDELAQAAAVPQGNISRLERGDVRDVLVSTLLDLAQALHVDAMTLLQPVVDSAKAAPRARRDPARHTATTAASQTKPTRQRTRKAAPVG
jgi:transcriptional regulator with XRE-family HTH domain